MCVSIYVGVIFSGKLMMDDLRPGLGGILGLMDHDHHHHHLHHHHPTAVHTDKQRASKGASDSSNELGSLYGLPVNAAGDSSHHNTPSPGRGSLAEQNSMFTIVLNIILYIFYFLFNCFKILFYLNN